MRGRLLQSRRLFSVSRHLTFVPDSHMDATLCVVQLSQYDPRNTLAAWAKVHNTFRFGTQHHARYHGAESTRRELTPPQRVRPGLRFLASPLPFQVPDLHDATGVSNLL